MLRVGLTGGLGSGKSTAARLFAALGAHVLQADAIGRELMEPGQLVYAAIVKHFGQGVVSPDARLDRSALAKIAFVDGRVEEFFPGDADRAATFARRGSVVVGDIHPAAFASAGAYTPVPGGVGALTIAMLMQNTVTAAKLRRGLSTEKK